ncbi:MAG: nuclease-related domain-containing protein [Solibacillus isronensis]
MPTEREKVISMTTQELKAIFTDKSLSPQDRGEIGERAVTRLGVYWASQYKDHIWQSSYMYPQGPVHQTQNSMEAEPVTEIDLLIITPYRVFVIEIKTVYGIMKIDENSQIEISKTGEFTGDFEKKNYFQQNEMHARHLYYHLAPVLPDGKPEYIIPLVVVAGNMRFEDHRPEHLIKAYPIVTATNLYQTLTELNQPLEYLLNINKIKTILVEKRVLDKQRLLNSQTFK